MGKKGLKTYEAPNCKKYGVPIYGAGWVPSAVFSSIGESTESTQNDDEDVNADTKAFVSNYVVLAGGGGEGRSGIPNAILLSKFDFESNVLSDQPVQKFVTGEDLPYRIAIHPGGEGLICSFSQSCRWYEWDAVKGKDECSLTIKASDKVLTNLEDVGQQLALTFNMDGSLLAVGGEDGKLRVLRWPSMEIILFEEKAHASVKDLDFSPVGDFLVSVGSGPGRVWDVNKSTAITTLQKGNDEIVGFCKFCRSSDVLYIGSMQGGAGRISIWNTTNWKKIGSKKFRDPISAFNISFDGKFLAIGTIQGDVTILRNRTNNTLVEAMPVVEAHLGLVTTLMFSKDSSSLLSTSLDASSWVTLIKEERRTGFPLKTAIFLIILAIILNYVKSNGLLPMGLDYPFRL